MLNYDKGAKFLEDRAAEKLNQEPVKKNTYNKILDDDKFTSDVDILSLIPETHLAHRIVKYASEVTFMPVNSVFLMGIGLFSSISCRKYSVAYETHKGAVPIGLYAVAEQPPGSAKDWSMSFFEKPFWLALDKTKANVSKRIDELQNQGGLTDDDEEELARLKKHKTMLFVTNATPESLELILDNSQGFFSAVSCEKGLINSLTGLSYGGGRENNNDLILNGFQAGKVASLRVTRKAYQGTVVGAFVSFAQRGSIEKILSCDSGSGYSQRFLMMSEPDNLGKRDHHRRVEVNSALEYDYAKACEFAIDIFMNPLKFEELTQLKPSAAGYWMIAEFRNRIEPHLLPGGAYSSEYLSGAVSKINMQIMKLAGNLHLLSADRWSIDISDDTIVYAINICGYLLKNFRKILAHRGFIGKKAEFVSILSLFEKDARPRTERSIIQSKIKTEPFCNLGVGVNKSDAVRNALIELIEQEILYKTYTVDGAEMYGLAQ